MPAASLTGRRVLVTRAAGQAGRLSQGLRALGIEPVQVPVLEILPPLSFAPLDDAIQRLSGYDWLILTSANAVHMLAGRASFLGVSLTAHAALKIAAVGASTAAEVNNAGLKVSLVPEKFVAESLIAALDGKVAGSRILLVRAASARDVLPDALRAAGASVAIADAYRNSLPESAAAQLQAALRRGIDAATFTSSSSATHLERAAKAAGIQFPLPGVSAVSIGPVTTQTLRGLGWEPAAEAEPSDISGLLAAVARLFAH